MLNGPARYAAHAHSARRRPDRWGPTVSGRLIKTKRYATGSVGFKEDRTVVGHPGLRHSARRRRNPRRAERVWRGLTGGPPATARRAKHSAEQGESRGGLGASWGGRDCHPDDRWLRRTPATNWWRSGQIGVRECYGREREVRRTRWCGFGVRKGSAFIASASGRAAWAGRR